MTAAITSALANVTTIFTQATTMITENEIAMVFIGFTLLAGGIGLFRRVVKR